MEIYIQLLKHHGHHHFSLLSSEQLFWEVNPPALLKKKDTQVHVFHVMAEIIVSTT